MNIAELDARALEYWCARALVEDDEPVVFAAVEPELIVTLTHGGQRKIEQRFAPVSVWADTADVLDRVRELRLTIDGDGQAHCSARFLGGDEAAYDGDGPSARTALVRAFVRARCGESVDDRYPRTPHAVHRGAIVPYDGGAALPTYADDRARHGDETGDIRSVPRP